MINILNPDGTLNENAGTYQGLTMHTRPATRVVADLEAARPRSATSKTARSTSPTRDRSKTPIEPYLADQWFVKMGDCDEASGLAQIGDGRGDRRPREVLPGALRQELSRLARRETRLAHQPATVVGTSDSGVDADAIRDADAIPDEAIDDA